MKKELIKTENYLLVVDDDGKQLAHLPLNGSPILEGVPLLSPMDVGVFAYPTHFEFEVEDYRNEVGDESRVLIHTLINSQGQIVACGKYIYEL